MADERTSPEIRLLINGAETSSELTADVLEVVVTQYIEGGDRFDVLISALDSQTQALKWIDSDQVQPGNEIRIQFGYLGTFETLVVGEITAVRVDYANDQGAQLRIQGFDRLHRLRRGRNTRVFHDVKDNQVAEQIASELGLEPETTDTEVVHPYLLQNNLSDIDFLMQRAKRIRFEVFVLGRKLVFRPAANHLGETLSLEYMRDLKSFNVRLSTVCQVSDVAVRGWNPASKRKILSVARVGSETTRMKGSAIGPEIAEDAFGAFSTAITDLPIASQAEADQIAQARFNDLAIELTSGEGEAVGNPALRAGTTVDLRGLGKRFAGPYYVIRAEHRAGPEVGYITRFEVRRNAS